VGPKAKRRRECSPLTRDAPLLIQKEPEQNMLTEKQKARRYAWDERRAAISKLTGVTDDGEHDERPAKEAQFFYKLFLRGAMSADEIVSTLLIGPRRQKGLVSVPRLRIRDAFLQLVKEKIASRRRGTGRRCNRNTVRRGSR
jgi:hypothetical protein